MVCNSVKDKEIKMTMSKTSQNIFIRISTLLGLSVAVYTVIYFTPMPDQNFKSCDRPCHELDWPMICRVKLYIEMYHTDNHICQDCRKNSSNTLHYCKNIFCHLTEENIPKTIITANRQIPGPPIHVCKNDILIVDVINRIPGKSLTIHWRGQSNHEAPFMDGVPMVTQCPISSYTIFQYKFRASHSGTHFYHAFTDSDRSNGLFGALVVRKADKVDSHRKLYDFDLKEHVILISEWSGDFTHGFPLENDLSKTLLINGKAPNEKGTSLTIYNVDPGKRYRFRLAYTSGPSGCPVTLSIDNHLLKIIELDGNPTSPYEVSSIQLSKGERLDFVLKANQQFGVHYLNVKSTCDGNTIEGLAIINYTSSPKYSNKTLRSIDAELNDARFSRHFQTSLCQTQIDKLCLSDVKSLEKVPEELQNAEVDTKIFLEIDYKFRKRYFYSNNDDGLTDLRNKIYQINNLTFSFPSSPLLTQPSDVSSTLICNGISIPDRCQNGTICECVHLENIPLGNSVEMFIINQANSDEEHILHLHGNHFYVVGHKQFDHIPNKLQVEKMNQQNMLTKRNLINPVKKDTIRIPKYSVVILRFLANNPGLWILRDEKSHGWTKGMDVVFEVGGRSQMVSTPSNFPTCGNYIGPDFFLL